MSPFGLLYLRHFLARRNTEDADSTARCLFFPESETIYVVFACIYTTALAAHHCIFRYSSFFSRVIAMVKNIQTCSYGFACDTS